LSATAADKIKELIEPTVEALGFELVRVAFLTSGGARQTMVLQIMAERPDGTMHVDDCARLSRELSVLLDVEDPIPSEYLLEVSSPGVDRPLVRLKDFERFAGYEVKIETAAPVDGRRRFKGLLKGVDGQEVIIDVEDGGECRIFHDDIQKSKLVMTDELLAAAAKQQRQES
tara:strand:+ start:33 stop:548 length:516 start_codon:yes stop_codon:yes gene_type:complete